MNDPTLLNRSDAFVCESRIDWVGIVSRIPMYLIVCMEHGVCLAAVLVNRKKLRRQSCVFLCITSNIASFVLIPLLLLLRDVISAAYPKYAVSTAGTMTPFKVLDSALVGMTISMLFSGCSNVLAIVFVLLDGGLFIDLTHVGVQHDIKLKWYADKKAKVAKGFIVWSWFLPILMTLLSMSVFNITTECYCEMPLVVGKPCPTQEDRSLMFRSVHKTFGFINIVLWALQMALVYAFLAYAVHQYKKQGKKGRGRCNRIEFSSVKSNSENTQTLPADDNINPGKNLSDRFHFCFIFVALYTICTAPFVILVAGESTYTFKKYSYFFKFFPGASHFFYVMAAPIVKMAYMPSLRSGIGIMLSTMKSKLC